MPSNDATAVTTRQRLKALNKSDTTLEVDQRKGWMIIKILWVQGTILLWSIAYMVPCTFISWSLFEIVNAVHRIDSAVFGKLDRAALALFFCNLSLDIRSMFLFGVLLRGKDAFRIHLTTVTPFMIAIPMGTILGVSALAVNWVRVSINVAVIVTVYIGTCVFQYVFCDGMALSDALKVKSGELQEIPTFKLSKFLIKNVALSIAIFVLIVLPIVCIQFGTSVVLLVIFNVLLSFGQIYVLVVVS
ncbi:hypothetical protein BC829DRAFT_396145 [Chytridium lagenaria]|nr:hypothetical protein BC829DRAFT_396145 [Chytridium lagenaria]